jgi:hypothetical protein
MKFVREQTRPEKDVDCEKLLYSSAPRSLPLQAKYSASTERFCSLRDVVLVAQKSNKYTHLRIKPAVYAS